MGLCFYERGSHRKLLRNPPLPPLRIKTLTAYTQQKFLGSSQEKRYRKSMQAGLAQLVEQLICNQ